MNLVEKELTQKILGACFEVSNKLGCGFPEEVYERALPISFGKPKLDYRRFVC